MKKKKLFLFMALTSTIAGLTSCNVSNDNNSTNIVEQTTTTSTSSQAPVYNLEDNELSQKVFNEIKKTLPNITYDEFLLYGRKIGAYSDHIELEYSSIRISIALDGTFRSKSEYTYDDSGNLLTQADSKYENNAWVYTYKSEYTYDANGKKSTETYSRYINNEWIKIDESIYINGELSPIFLLYLNPDGTFISKYEYTYDANGKKSTETYSEYKNNEWIKTNEIIYINGEAKMIYSVSFNSDDTFKSKFEYTYDANGNMSSLIQSEYKNNEWIKTYESIFINGDAKIIYYVSFNLDGTFKRKSEYTYDANGNRLTYTYSEYKNNEWIKTNESIFINGDAKIIYSVSFNSDDTFKSKEEYTYDANGNELTSTHSEYKNNAWVYYAKYEYTYDNDGNRLTETRYDYINGNWVLQD